MLRDGGGAFSRSNQRRNSALRRTVLTLCKGVSVRLPSGVTNEAS